MSNVIELPQFSDSTREVLRPEVVDYDSVASNESGVIVRVFVVMGTFVEKTLRYIALHGGRLGRYLGRNVVSFVRAIPLWLSDLSYKIRWSRGTLALSRAKRQTPVEQLEQGDGCGTCAASRSTCAPGCPSSGARLRRG